MSRRPAQSTRCGHQIWPARTYGSMLAGYSMSHTQTQRSHMATRRPCMGRVVSHALPPPPPPIAVAMLGCKRALGRHLRLLSSRAHSAAGPSPTYGRKHGSHSACPEKAELLNAPPPSGGALCKLWVFVPSVYATHSRWLGRPMERSSLELQQHQPAPASLPGVRRVTRWGCATRGCTCRWCPGLAGPRARKHGDGLRCCQRPILENGPRHPKLDLIPTLARWSHREPRCEFWMRSRFG